MDEKLQQQIELEKAFKKEHKLILDNSIEFMNRLTKTENAKPKLIAMFESIEENEPISEEVFDIVGTYCYLIGFDFASQPFLRKVVCENVRKRMANYVFDDEIFVEKLIDVIQKIKPNMITAAKEAMMARIEKKVFIDTKSPQSMMIKPKFRNLVENSMFEVKYAESIDKILSKTIMTTSTVKDTDLNYGDLLTMNSVMVEYGKIAGFKGINAMNEMNSNKEWARLLEKAVRYYDDRKLAYVLQDAIISLNECVGAKFTKEQLINVLMGRYTDENYKEFQQTFIDLTKPVEETNQETPETSDKLDAVNQRLKNVTEEEMKKMLQENPLCAMLVTIEEYSEGVLTADNFEQKVDVIFEDLDGLRDFYGWMSGTLKIPVQDVERDYSLIADMDLNVLRKKVSSLLEYTAATYKSIAEMICADLPEIKISEIKILFTNVISHLILDTVQQKTILISNFNDTNVKTYQHVVQLMTIVESCEIKGTGLEHYAKLKKFIEEIKGMVSTLKEIDNLEALSAKMSVYTNISKMFELYLK